MEVVTYEVVTPTPIENVTVTKVFSDGVHKIYRLKAVDGYVLHDNRYDYYAFDEESGMPSTEVTLGYTGGTVSANARYDFTANPYEFYAVLRTSVPENQIFGGVDNDHEVM